MPKELTIILEAIQHLDDWIIENGWAGWDPYDVKEKILNARLWKRFNAPAVKYFQKLLFELIEIYPLTARKIFQVKPEINAKAMGLFLAAYANLHQVTRRKRYLKKAFEAADWLIQNRVRDYKGYSWGYPFNWHSIRYLPKNTPSSVVTATAGDGFFLLYKITKNPKLLDICKEICIFFLESLNITYNSRGARCYSYTPIDDYQVHNANLFVGEFLVRIGRETDDLHLIERGLKCGRFALMKQQPEGYLPYWGLAQTDSHSSGRMRTDHYHSGFEIRMLYKIWKHTGQEAFQLAYLKYYCWYLRNMFILFYIPKMTSKRFYPVNIHSCAEALLCQSTLLPDHPERISDIMNTADWVLNKMEYAAGCYAYLIKHYPVMGELRTDLTMIRWGQAWMLRAYSELLKFLMKSRQFDHKTFGTQDNQ